MKSIKREEVITLLNQDDYYRRLRKWPLISYNELSNPKKKFVSEALFEIKGWMQKYDHLPLEKIKEEVNILHPFTDELLTKFHNNLVACGGSICKSIVHYNIHQRRTDDIDLFFYDLDIYQANMMRIEVIEYMINVWKSHIGQSVKRYHWRGYNDHIVDTIIKDVKFYIQRNEYVTTLHVEELCDCYENAKVYMYQFIHRIYPDISSIIGGFDLSASAVAYNGKEICTTPLGAWSLINRSLIIDMGRRSTSYEHRLLKYSKYGFKLIFPGLSDMIVNDELVKTYNNGSFSRFREKLEKLAKDNGYFINDEYNDLKEIFLRRENGGKQIDEKDDLAFHKVQKEKDILPHLTLTYNDYDYGDNFCEYRDSIYIKQSNCNQYDWFDSEGPNEDGKCWEYEYYINKLSDYGNDEKYLKARSDYHHSHMYYKHVPSANATRLRLNNLNGVVSILYIHNHENIREKLFNDVNNPNLGINDYVIELYKNNVHKEINSFIEANYNGHQTTLIKYLGSFTSEILDNCNDNTITRATESMIETIWDNEKICKKNLTGLKWITENPGRQWTSSINPVFENPRDWYGKHYIPVLVGIPPEIETTLRLMRFDRTESVWVTLPEDIFDLLLSYILRAYANEAWQYIK